MIIGITGGFGTGKTTVANFFKEFGAEIIDADEMVHKLIRPGSDVYSRIVGVFGKGVLTKKGTINRPKLASAVFLKKESLKRLCNIIHPEVIKSIKQKAKQIRRRKRDSIIVIDAPLLIEAGLGGFVDKMVVVKTTKKAQYERCRRKGFEDCQIGMRISSQMPLKDKLRLADFVIDNEGSLSQTRRQVRKIFNELR